jgi:flagellar M-ring protein FliF
VKPTGKDQLDEATVLAIRDMVANAFPCLKPEDVAVADSNGPTWRGSIGTPEESQRRQAKRASEQDLRANILKALRHIPDVDVQVNVELKREGAVGITAVGGKAADRAALPVATRQEAKPNAPGPVSQKPNVAAVLDSLLNGTSGEGPGSSSEPTAAAAEPVEKPPIVFTPISARALVRVPIGYFTSLWQQRNPAEAGKPAGTPDQTALDQIRIEESATIQRCVAALLPPARNGATLAEMVTVTPFAEIPSAVPSVAFRDDLLNWAVQSWRTLAAAGIAVVCLFGLWLIARAKPANADQAAAPAADDVAVDATPPTPAKVAAPHWRRPAPPADRPIREELSKLVEDDPETAANILRKWIGQVS